jgi:hypothetical protein
MFLWVDHVPRLYMQVGTLTGRTNRVRQGLIITSKLIGQLGVICFLMSMACIPVL